MAHKTKIGGTAYEIDGGKVLVGGSGYSIDKGRTKVGGTGYDIAFGTPIGSLAVGTSVFFNYEGSQEEFIVVHQGNPDTSKYNESCNGTWLLQKEVHFMDSWDYQNNDYKNSFVHECLNGDILGLFDSNIQSAIKQVKIPYWNGTGVSGSLATGSIGLTTKLFLLIPQKNNEENGYAHFLVCIRLFIFALSIYMCYAWYIEYYKEAALRN